jgi:hypothetical protein
MDTNFYLILIRKRMRKKKYLEKNLDLIAYPTQQKTPRFTG